MATFFSNMVVGYWASNSNTFTGTLTGNVSRSGNTVTLSSMSLSINAPVYGGWGTSSFTITVNGASTTRTISVPPTTFAVNNTSFGVSATQTSANVGWSTSDGYNGTFTVTFPSGAVAPSGGSVSVASRTWNSVTCAVKLNSYGTPGSNSGRYIEARVCSGKSLDTGRFNTAHNTTSSNITVNNSSTYWTNALTLRGCKKVQLGWYANNTSVYAEGWGSEIYLPPAPLSALSVTSQSGSSTANSVTVNFSMTGGNSTNNENVTVDNQYRYSSDNGSTWSSWTSVGTGSPWTAKTGSFTVQYGESCKIQARQVYQSLASETKEISFSSTACTRPTFTSASASATSYNSVSVTGVIASYGEPVIASSARIGVGVSTSGTSVSNRRESWSVSGTYPNTRTATINNSSTLIGSLTILGCTTLYPFVQADNGVCAGSSVLYGPAIKTPPAPMDRIVLNENRAVGSESVAKLTAYGSTSNNLSGQTVKTQYRYSIGNDSSYSEWADVNATSEAPGNGKVINLSGMPPSTTIYVQTRQYQDINNPGSAITSSFITKQTPPSVDYVWNDTRDTLSASASVESAVTRLQILYGYSNESASIVIADEANTTSASGSVQYPKHNNQAIFAKVRLYYSDGTYDVSTTKVIPVPHPIIGVVRYPDGHQEYIVDIVERKTNGTVTPQWQSGERVITAKPSSKSS